MRNRSHKQSHLRIRTGEYVGGDSIDRIYGRSHGSVDGFVYANNHRQIPEIVNEPAQPHQPISIVIQFVYGNIRLIIGFVDGDIRSVIGG